MTIRVEELGKRYNREWIFKKLTHTFEAGKTYAILGPNGCGKSTLLQVLWGQLPASAGTLHYNLNINDKEIELADAFKHISIATPYMELIEEFTLLEMLHFHVKFKQPRKGTSIVDLLELMELSHTKNKTLNQFSSGMKQRVKLGLAFFSEASVVFLDEPTTNLDKKSTDWYLKQLSELPNETLVFIASNQEHEYPIRSEKVEILRYK
jgi:ABC-type multidrug transport system ATPase subunit